MQIHSQTIWSGLDISLAFCCGLGAVHETAMGLLRLAPWKLSLPEQKLLLYPDDMQHPTVHCAYPIDIENQLRLAICAQDTDKLQQQFERFARYFSGQQLYQPQEIKESYTRFLWTAINVAKELGHGAAIATRSRQVMESILSAQDPAELNAIAEAVQYGLLSAAQQMAQSPETRIVQRAKSLIHEFYADGITLEEIARKLGITPEYLSTQFRKQSGENFSSYIRSYRIQKAKELLLGTQMKLHRIAAKVGYADPKYFGQVFKKCTGMLPAEYRRAHK